MHNYAAITGASQHLTRVKVNIGTTIFAKTMVLFSREAGIADNYIYYSWLIQESDSDDQNDKSYFRFSEIAAGNFGKTEIRLIVLII